MAGKKSAGPKTGTKGGPSKGGSGEKTSPKK